MFAFNRDDKNMIKKLFYELVSVQSDTGTKLEKDIEDKIYEWFIGRPYYRRNAELAGKYIVEDDPLKRSVVWALVKGNGEDTVVLMNHHDAVDIYEYGELRDTSLKPEELKKALKQLNLDDDVVKDIESDEWIFGRGTADMKAGTAIQMWMTYKASSIENFNGNLLFLSVSDEENLSAGMRGAIKLLVDIREKHGLKYKSIINSEPFSKEDDGSGIIYEGSVGKFMPVIYVRGKKSHIGQIYTGLNPSYLLSMIHTRIELNVDFSDSVDGEMSPPPSWVYLRDRKKCYDASIPEASAAYFSMLSLYTSPKEIIERLRNNCEMAFVECIDNINKSYREFCRRANKEFIKLPWKPRILTYSELYNMVLEKHGEGFLEKFNKLVCISKDKMVSGEINIQEATIRLVEEVVEFLDDKEPLIVLAISAPFYPHICNRDIGLTKEDEFIDIVNKFSLSKWGQGYKKRNYFMGISDLSYTGLLSSDSVINTIESNTPGWGSLYYIPFDNLKSLSMPTINIGPWGKDLHKITERVLEEDVFYRTPQIIANFIDKILNSDETEKKKN
ncbi:M20/M25/M40 family metallo-hydrolase [Wukongibacter sp. M2B1]|uniref:M20/M25/M40 family metallo-hydrolase n=1 Tax=Wukongibacter sp. M2B1 TaxID=3088895 RepID=UPI003D7B13C6